jgi:hypothetical protein
MAKLSERQEAMVEGRMGCVAAIVGVMMLPFVVICAIFLTLGVSQMLTQARMNSAAVPIEARVLSAELGRTTTGSSGRGRTLWIPEIRYEYTVDGQRFESDSYWAVAGSMDSKSGADAIVARHAPGIVVTAHVDPTDPARSMLAVRWDSKPYAGAAWGLLCLELLLAMLTVIVGWRWIGIAAPAAFLVSAAGVAGAGGLVWHWMEFVPPADRPVWMLSVIAGAGGASLLPTAALFPARRGARLYREALAETSARELQP